MELMFDKVLSSEANNSADFDVNVDIFKNVNKSTVITQDVDLTGNSAILFADVEAVGLATEVEVDASILTIANELSSISLFAESATVEPPKEDIEVFGALAWDNGTSDSFSDIVDGDDTFSITFSPEGLVSVFPSETSGIFEDVYPATAILYDILINPSPTSFTLDVSGGADPTALDAGDIATLDSDLTFTYGAPSSPEGTGVTLFAGAEFVVTDFTGTAIEFGLVDFNTGEGQFNLPAGFPVLGAGTAEIQDYEFSFELTDGVGAYSALASLVPVVVHV